MIKKIALKLGIDWKEFRSFKGVYGYRNSYEALQDYVRYARVFSDEEIARCEAREEELHRQLQEYKEQGYKIVKLVTPEGHGKDYEEMIGFCFYIKDLIKKKYLTVHPFASNYYVPCEDYDSCGCTRFIWKPKEWF